MVSVCVYAGIVATSQEMADQERSWFEREKDANQRALKRMRALIPVGVTGLTVAQLEHRAIESGSLYPKELALRLKVSRDRKQECYRGDLKRDGG